MKDFLIASALSITIFFSISYIANAFGLPFGGRITYMVPCENGAVMITVIGPRPGIYVYQVGATRLYRNFVFTPGANLLGSYILGPGTCVIYPATFTGLPLITKMGVGLAL